MKTLFLCLFASAFLFSCQEEASVNDAKENIWKKKTEGQGGLSPVTRDNADDATNAPIDGGLGILLVTGVAYGAKRMMKQRKQKAA
jgi:hypothetical protein